MEKEIRKARIIIGKAGGNAGANSLSYKISLPSTWIKSLGIDRENRDVFIEFNGKKITISKGKK